MTGLGRMGCINIPLNRNTIPGMLLATRRVISGERNSRTSACIYIALRPFEVLVCFGCQILTTGERIYSSNRGAMEMSHMYDKLNEPCEPNFNDQQLLCLSSLQNYVA